ncbi:type IV pilus modification PilV family protein [Marinicrinis sediminis]|uniref:Prepilin-type N-terminal cleavage/methylation domain-containing protein n=1 Tax=Marinicrinis sediminis TaxID=1652465 RepID=A0ABW5RCX4_9BACL
MVEVVKSKRKWKRIRLHQNEKGMSLVEVLSAMLILAMIVAILYTFLLMGITVYKKVSTETTLRNQANIIFGQILDEMKDGVYAQAVPDKEKSSEISTKEMVIVKPHIVMSGTEQLDTDYVKETKVEIVEVSSDPLMYKVQIQDGNNIKEFQLTDNKRISNASITYINAHQIELMLEFTGEPGNMTRSLEKSQITMKQQIPLFRLE